MQHLIELRDVYKIYQMGDTAVHALDGVTLTVDAAGNLVDAAGNIVYPAGSWTVGQ